MNKTFDEMIQACVEYKEKYGHLSVPLICRKFSLSYMAAKEIYNNVEIILKSVKN